MKVSDLMSRSVISVSPETTTTTAAKLLSRHNIGAIPVVGADGRLRGIVTDRDIVLRCIVPEDDPGATPVREIMTRRICSISPSTDTREATEAMASGRIRRLPVIEGGRLVGMLSLGDLARSQACHTEAAEALSDISAPGGSFLNR